MAIAEIPPVRSSAAPHRSWDESLPRAGHHQPDLLYRPRRRKAARTNLGAVHDRAAAGQPIGIIQVVESFARGAIAAVDDEPVGLQQPGRSHESVRVPPERWALSRAARAQDAFIESVELCAILGG